VLAQDAVSKAEQVDGDLRPLEAKAIAEEGFIYGLPLVMSYGIMYEASIDRTSGQFKAPINQIKNEPRVFIRTLRLRCLTATRHIPFSF
jgi:hypothetical protein